MSLLEQLALYSCKFDSFFPQLSALTNYDSYNTKTQHFASFTPKSTYSHKTTLYSFERSKVNQVQSQQKHSEVIDFSLDKVQLMKKCSRLNWMVSTVQNKVRKLKYEFLIYLSNFKKKALSQESKEKTPKSKFLFISQNEPKEKINNKINKLERLLRIVQVKDYSQISWAFTMIQKMYYKALCQDQTAQGLKKDQTQSLLLKDLKPAKIIQWIKPKSSEKVLEFQEGLNRVALFQETNHQSPNVQSLVQARQLQTPDSHDYINIFISDSFAQVSSEKVQQSTKNSLFNKQSGNLAKLQSLSLSQPFSDLELTTIQPKPKDRRRNSQLTNFTGVFSESLYFFQEEKQKVQIARKTSLKAEKTQEQQIADISMEEQQSIESNFSPAVHKNYKDSPSKNESFGKKQVRRSMGTVENEIDQQHARQFAKYLQFKKIILTRRESTIKQIQQSQQAISKLLKSFKANKTQQLIKSNKKTSLNTNSKSKNHQKPYLFKRISSVKKSLNKNSSSLHLNSLTDQKNLLTDKNTLFTQRNIELVSQQTSLKTIDVYCNYIKEKKMMESCKQSPTKDKQKNRLKQKTAKNKEKNLLQICKNTHKKEPRVQVRVDLGKKKVVEKVQKGLTDKGTMQVRAKSKKRS